MPFLLALFVAALPTYLLRFPIFVAPGVILPTTLLEILFWLLFATWLATDARKPGAWSAYSRYAVPLALFATGATIGIFISDDTRSALGLWRAYILEPLLFFPMCADILARYKKGRWVLGAFAFTATWIGITAIYQKVTGYGIPNPIWAATETRRITSVFGFPNAVALLLAPMIVLLAAQTLNFLRAKETKEKLLAIPVTLATLLGATSIVFAISEGGAVAVGAGSFVYGVFDKKLRPWALGIFIAVCLGVVAVPYARNYVTSIVTLSDDSGSVRTTIWAETANMLHDKPIFGAGLSGYPTGILPYHNAVGIEIFQYPHTIIMNLWSETGLLGLLGFIGIIWTFFASGITLFKKEKGGWIVPAVMSAMTALLVHGLVDVPYFKNDLAFLFWTLIAFMQSAHQTHTPLTPVIASEAKRSQPPVIPPHSGIHTPAPPIKGHSWS